MCFLDWVVTGREKVDTLPPPSLRGGVDQDSDAGAYRLREVETKQR